MPDGLTPQQQAELSGSKQPLIIGVLVTLLVLTNTTSVVRIAVSARRDRLHADDYLILLAFLLSDGVIAALLAATGRGLGLHQDRLLLEDDGDPRGVFADITLIVWVYAVLNGLCFSTIKLSVLFFYRRLFWVAPWFKVAWWACVAYTATWMVGSTLFYVFQCAPVNYYWNKVYGGTDGKCIDSLASIGTPIILNNLGDLFVLFLPLPSLVHLNMSREKRIRLLVLFAIGLMATVAGFVRFGLIFTTNPRADFTYNSVEFLLWSNIEEALGIFCANIPILSSLSCGSNKDKSHSTSTGATRARLTATWKKTDGANGDYTTLGPKTEEHSMDDLQYRFGHTTKIERGTPNWSRSQVPASGISVLKTTSQTTDV
ncbi:hypothetical protein GGR56DRAFT_600576 [Xylariaceae sp. FL0804]|nr:hypothetical protein GGR56DRAFT_600576 [Xylariaceae sp. FL0804]